MDKFPGDRWTKWRRLCVPGRSCERPGLDDLSICGLRGEPLSARQNFGFMRFLKSRRCSEWTLVLQPGPFPAVIDVSKRRPAITRNM